MYWLLYVSIRKDVTVSKRGANALQCVANGLVSREELLAMDLIALGVQLENTTPTAAPTQEPNPLSRGECPSFISDCAEAMGVSFWDNKRHKTTKEVCDEILKAVENMATGTLFADAEVLWLTPQASRKGAKKITCATDARSLLELMAFHGLPTKHQNSAITKEYMIVRSLDHEARLTYEGNEEHHLWYSARRISLLMLPIEDLRQLMSKYHLRKKTASIER